jgi:acyl-CoA reductase-like NAD-dependent aldehyde dehydrogenase
MPPAIPLREIPRTLANVLLDLKEARSDWDQALQDAECAGREGNPRLHEEAGDRMSEADERIDALREEFAAMFVAATGLTWKQIEAAIDGCLL